jgi:hypothetical protein
MRFKYGPHAKPLAQWAEDILEKILFQAGIEGAEVTSTKRSAHDQARIMYYNIEAHGEKAQRKLYKPAGQEVISVYVHQKALGRDREGVIHEMELKIIEIGPQKISAHCIEDQQREVLDVAPSSIPEVKKPVFEGCVTHATGVTKFLKPPIDPAYHIEMKVI